MAAAAGLGVRFVVPLVPLSLWVFADRWSYPAALPQEWGSDNLGSALAQGAVPAFFRSLGLGLMVSAIATPLGVLAARTLAFRPSRWSTPLSALLFAPLPLPAFATVFGLNTLVAGDTVRVAFPTRALAVVGQDTGHREALDFPRPEGFNVAVSAAEN